MSPLKKIQYLVYEMRPAHWVKNFLIFLPLIFASKLTDLHSVWLSFEAFLIFSVAASAIYIANDLLDCDRDKLHPIKKRRPLASGSISKAEAQILALILTVTALYFSFRLHPFFFLTVCGYLILNAFYSLILKELVILDVMTLAAFYILRILAGIFAIDAPFSHWMIICIGLLALFLGFNKRRHELKFLEKFAAKHRSVLKKYDRYFIDQMITVVMASTLFCYTLYTVDSETVAKFGTKNLLWTIPFVYYAIFRYLYLVHKRGKGGDPVRIFLSDPVMIANCFIWLLVSSLIIYHF